MTTGATAGAIEACRESLSLSVVIATYNGSRFVEEQLESIARQTLLPDELVVSDDGSTDDTLDIVRRFAGRAPFAVRVLEKPARLGFADNFLHAAAACHGDVVAFSDQDDVWLPRKLEIGMQRLIDDDSLLSMHRLTVTDGELRPVRLHQQGIDNDVVHAPLDTDPDAGWGNTMMFRRELATLIPREQRPQHPGFERLLSHDTWLYVIAAAIGRVSHIAEPLILYRQHGTNTAGVTAPSLAGRMKGLYVDPTTGFRLNQALTEKLATLMAQLAERSDGELRQRAHAASLRFAQRSARLASRIALYEGASPIARIGSYLAVLRSLRGDRPAWQRAHKLAGKDFVLGVLGIDRRRREVKQRQTP